MSGENQAAQADTNAAGTASDTTSRDVIDVADRQTTHSTGEGSDTDRAAVSWKENLSEDLRGHDHLKGFEGTLDDFVKSSLETRGKVPVVPETVDNYEYELSQDSGLTAERLKPFLEFAHAQRMTNETVKAFIKREEAAIKARREKQETQAKETADALKKDWGDGYDSRAQRVNDMVNFYADRAGLGDNFHKALESKGLLNNPVVARFLDAIGAEFREGHFAQGGQGPQRKGKKRTADGRPILDFEPPDKK